MSSKLENYILYTYSITFFLTVLSLLNFIFPPCIFASPDTISKVKEIRLPVNRDTWVSSFKDEKYANLGGAKRLKMKGFQEFSIVDFYPEELRGRVITDATLHLHCRTVEAPLRRITVSTISSEWVEGKSTRYRNQTGSASFNWAAQDIRQWLANPKNQ